MFGDEAVGNAANLFYIRSNFAAFFQDLQIGHGFVGKV